MLNKLLNDFFYPLESFLIKKYSKPELPVIFIISLPRAGSTLLHQLLVQKFKLGYISNYQAKFWKTPYIGALIGDLLLDKDVFRSDFQSKFGNTKGKLEPHEWGWFWKRFFSMSDKHVDFNRLKKELSALEKVYSEPLIFDNCYTFPHLKAISQQLESAIFINLKRDTFFVANSIINARMKKFGKIENWYAEKPDNYMELLNLKPIEQCVAQVFYLEKQINEELKNIAKKRIIDINIEDFYENSHNVLDSIREFVKQHGYSLKRKKNEIPKSFNNRNAESLIDDRFSKDLKKYYAKYFHL